MTCSTSGTDPSPPPTFTISPARGHTDVTCARSLIMAYTDWLDLDLSYQGLEAELAGLPGKYSPEQGGEILLARSAQELDGVEGSAEVCRDAQGKPILGIICVRKLPETQFIGDKAPGDEAAPCRGEVKRLYVVPQARGLGVGSALIKSLLDRVLAADDGPDASRIPPFDELYLDTLPRMQGAIRQYTRAGFAPCGKYYDSPIEETLFFRWPREEISRDGDLEGLSPAPRSPRPSAPRSPTRTECS